MSGALYPTYLTDAEWAIPQPLIQPPKPGGRPASTSRREIVNAIQYLLRSGEEWRLLPPNAVRSASEPDGQSNRARQSRIFRAPEPRKRGPRGYDRSRKIDRKRDLLVSIGELVLEVVVHPRRYHRLQWSAADPRRAPHPVSYCSADLAGHRLCVSILHLGHSEPNAHNDRRQTVATLGSGAGRSGAAFASVIHGVAAPVGTRTRLYLARTPSAVERSL